MEMVSFLSRNVNIKFSMPTLFFSQRDNYLENLNFEHRHFANVNEGTQTQIQNINILVFKTTLKKNQHFNG